MSIRNFSALQPYGNIERRRITNSCTQLLVQMMMFEVCRFQTGNLPIHSDRTELKITTLSVLYKYILLNTSRRN